MGIDGAHRAASINPRPITPAFWLAATAARLRAARRRPDPVRRNPSVRESRRTAKHSPFRRFRRLALRPRALVEFRARSRNGTRASEHPRRLFLRRRRITDELHHIRKVLEALGKSSMTRLHSAGRIRPIREHLITASPIRIPVWIPLRSVTFCALKPMRSIPSRSSACLA